MCVSLIGTWMKNIAQPWLAYSLTSSAFLLSLVSALQFTPMLLFSLFAGAWTDKLPKKSILLFTQSASLIITLSFAILNSTGIIQYWHILVLAALMGIVNTLDMPARQSFVIELVGKIDLMNAIALNSSVFNLARIIGPALAGLVMGIWGLTVCFYANAISFGAVIISLLLMNPEHAQARHSHSVSDDVLQASIPSMRRHDTNWMEAFSGKLEMDSNMSAKRPSFSKPS